MDHEWCENPLESGLGILDWEKWSSIKSEANSSADKSVGSGNPVKAKGKVGRTVWWYNLYQRN